MKTRKNCSKCGLLYKWTQSDYNRKGWTCKRCGNINEKKNFARFLDKHHKKYGLCEKCGKLVKGYTIKKGTGWRNIGFKCECGTTWVDRWMVIW